ncbi:MAG TPA: Wzz/FepE/Etk N-terminal domain-containing protein, partial [Allocoleopsis sp.]
MGLDGDYQPLLPNGNGKQLSQLSSLYTADTSELDKDKFDLGQILAVARRRFIIIAGVAIAVSSGVVSRVLKQVPIYQGKFQLLVGSVSGEDKVEELTQSLSKTASVQVEGPDYETQIQVLWSSQVMAPIVKKIQTRYPEIDYGTLRSKLAIARLAQTKILEVSYQDSDPKKIQFILEQVADGYLDYSKTEQRTALSQGIKFVNVQTEALKQRVEDLQQRIQNLRQNYKIVDPESQGQQLTGRAGDLAKQRQETESQLGEAQRLYAELQDQLAQLGVTPQQALASSALSEAPRYQQLLNQLADVQSKIAKESARLTDDNPLLVRLREEEQRLQPLVQQEAAKAIGNAPSGVPENAESLASPSAIRSDLTQKLVETRNQLQVLQVRTKELANAETTVSQQLKDWPIIARRYTDLQRQLSVATESLNRFLAVQEKLQIEESQKTPPWQKLSEPQTPQSPISPNVPRGVLLAAIAGLVAGAGAGLLAEKLDKAFHSPEELKDKTGLPVLGTIPHTKDLKAGSANPTGGLLPEADNLEVKLGGRSYHYMASPFLESFRSLHTNLQFLSPDEPIRSLVISSSVPADGKSTVTTYLAQAAAAMGQRVLLVDADLRRPTIHEKTDLPNVWGLS